MLSDPTYSAALAKEFYDAFPMEPFGNLRSRSV